MGKNVKAECDENKFSGGIKFRSGYVHERNVELNGNSYSIKDKLQSRTPEPIVIHWHTPFNVIIQDKEVLIVNKEETLAAIRISERYLDDVQLSIRKDSYSWRSPSYLIREPATHFVFEILNSNDNYYEIGYIIECF